MDVALLGSRKPRHVPPDAWWLRTTFALATYLAGDGHRLCTSVGNLPYEAALYGAARQGRRILAFTSASRVASLHACLPPGFDYAGLELRLLPDGGGAVRDQAVVEAADLCIAVAVRPGGLMVRLLLDRWRRGRPVQVVKPPDQSTSTRDFLRSNRPARKEVAGNLALLDAGVPPADAEFHPAHSARVSPPPRSSPPAGLLETFTRWKDSPLSGPTLAHFTRACPGPWPGQPRWAYLEDLFQGGWQARRDALATLMHILEERRIRASSRLIRGRHAVVSLTEHKPDALEQLHRYRRHLIRWDFLPFGLVFDREWAEAQGAKPVHYLPEDAFSSLTDRDKPWFQKHTPPSCDYREEREWRVLGDLDFASAPPEAVRVVYVPG